MYLYRLSHYFLLTQNIPKQNKSEFFIDNSLFNIINIPGCFCKSLDYVDCENANDVICEHYNLL